MQLRVFMKRTERMEPAQYFVSLTKNYDEYYSTLFILHKYFCMCVFSGFPHLYIRHECIKMYVISREITQHGI